MTNRAISTQQSFNKISSEADARVYLESIRWKGKPTCPGCGSKNIYARSGQRAGYYDCRECRKHFTVRTGTVFEKSHVELRKWIYAIDLLMTARKRISSLQMSKDIGVTQRTAWFILRRLRLADGNPLEKLRGIVKVDEAHIGGKKNNRHAKKHTQGELITHKELVV